MALRRSNRRITITGSSVFSASTPVVPPPIKHNVPDDNGNSSPQWISAEEAFKDLKTPKFTKVSRRTTLTRQNMFDDETIIGGAAADTSGFKAPRFFIPVSPPGVKTRSRRSSIMMGPPQPARAAKGKMGAKKANPNTEKDTKVIRKVVSKRSEVVPKTTVVDEKHTLTGITSRRSDYKRAPDGGDTEFGDIERLFSPIVDAGLKVDVKKGRRSLRHQTFESEESVVVSNEGIAQMNDFQTPRTHMSQGSENHHKFKPSTNDSEMPTMTSSTTLSQFTRTISSMDFGDNADKVETLSEMDVRKAATPKVTLPKTPLVRLSRVQGVKRQMSKEENDEIELVVKKMFSPSKEQSFKQKLKSPNSGKAASSPARTAILRDAVNTGRKSPSRNVIETSIRTPSRAAPKARKILGVSTSSSTFNENTQNRKSSEVKERVAIVDTAPSPSKSNDVSFREANENNITLSHSSHSQWCTIL